MHFLETANRAHSWASSWLQALSIASNFEYCFDTLLHIGHDSCHGLSLYPCNVALGAPVSITVNWSSAEQCFWKVIGITVTFYEVLALIAVHLACLSCHDCVMYCLYCPYYGITAYHTPYRTVEQSWQDQYGTVMGDLLMCSVTGSTQIKRVFRSSI